MSQFNSVLSILYTPYSRFSCRSTTQAPWIFRVRTTYFHTECEISSAVPPMEAYPAIPLLHLIPLRVLHDSRRITYPLVCVHTQWYVPLECGPPGDTEWQEDHDGDSVLFSGRFHITIVGRGNRLWFLSMCPGKSIERDWIGYHIWLGADITQSQSSTPEYILHSPDWTASVIRSWTRDNASTPHSVCVAVLRSTLLSLHANERVCCAEYTQRLYLLKYGFNPWSSALLSMEERLCLQISIPLFRN